MKLSRNDALAWGYITLLTAAVAISMLSATPNPADDHFIFQHFIETLAAGKLDLSIPGFHGMNIVAVPWYLITRSPIAQIEFQMFSGILIPLFAFIAGRKLFQSTWHGIVFASAMAMMPFLSFSSLRGWMVATYHCLVLLTIIGAAYRAKWTWIPLGFSIISLPFAAALIPLVMVATGDKKKPLVLRYPQVMLGLAIPVIYLAIQILQAGKIHVGVHEEFDAVGVWKGPFGMALNAAHGLQMMFSVHNYYFVDPAKTALGNMMHTTPVLVFLGLFGLFAPKQYFKDRWFPIVLLLGFLIGIGLNVAIDHMDHFYMETGLLFLILAALPVLHRHPLWVPIALATLHFQWFYFYLQFHEVFQLNYWFFLVPAVVDLAFLLWVGTHLRETAKIVQNTLFV